jgi:glyoxylase-like metal-dependent hydrolase (beta-lactamase superfamily II)
MEFIKINGNTYVIKSPTNIGVYTFKNKNCILIDTGIGNTHAKKIDNILVEKNLKPKFVINTHSHEDHCGGNKYFIENYPGVQVYTSQKTKTYIENSEIGAAILFSAKPLKKLMDKNKNSRIDFVLECGINKINDSKLEVISLRGHCDDQIGIITPDRVCFLGDSIFSSEILDKYSFPYLYDIEESIKTLKYLKEIDADYFVISHAKEVLDKGGLCKLADKNLKNIEYYKEQILEILSQPMTREDILENITILNDLSLNLKQYHLNFCTVSAFISYLYNDGIIKHSIEDGRLYYYV